MITRQIAELLQQLLHFLQDGKLVGMGFQRRARRRELAARVADELKRLTAPAHPAIREARERWATTSFLRIDQDERVIEVNPDGTTWVRAWVKISTVFPARADTPDRRRFEAAVADMPEEMRQIFLAHALDGLPYETIAEQLLVGVAEVQLQMGLALARLDEAVAHAGEKSP